MRQRAKADGLQAEELPLFIHPPAALDKFGQK